MDNYLYNEWVFSIISQFHYHILSYILCYNYNIWWSFSPFGKLHWYYLIVRLFALHDVQYLYLKIMLWITIPMSNQVNIITVLSFLINHWKSSSQIENILFSYCNNSKIFDNNIKMDNLYSIYLLQIVINFS